MYSTWFSRYWTLGKRGQETNEVSSRNAPASWLEMFTGAGTVK